MGITHFGRLSGIKGLYVGEKNNEVLVVDEDGNLYQTGVKVDLIEIESKIDDIKEETDKIGDIKTETDKIQSVKTETDKIGNSNQLWEPSSKTVLAYNNASYKHIHNPSYVYPVDCSLVTVASDSTANTFGDFVELVPENGIEVNFDIHWANIQNIDSNGTYIIEMHEVSNANLQVSEKFLGSFSVSRRDNFTRSFQVYTQIPVVEAGKRIGARVKNSDGSGEVSFNVTYHDYE